MFLRPGVPSCLGAGVRGQCGCLTPGRESRGEASRPRGHWEVDSAQQHTSGLRGAAGWFGHGFLHQLHKPRPGRGGLCVSEGLSLATCQVSSLGSTVTELVPVLGRCQRGGQLVPVLAWEAPHWGSRVGVRVCITWPLPQAASLEFRSRCPVTEAQGAIGSMR